jgi:hypothetical protein
MLNHLTLGWLLLLVLLLALRLVPGKHHTMLTALQKEDHLHQHQC